MDAAAMLSIHPLSFREVSRLILTHRKILTKWATCIGVDAFHIRAHGVAPHIHSRKKRAAAEVLADAVAARAAGHDSERGAK